MTTDEIDFDGRGLDLRIIRIIEAIDQTGSITAAAKALGISQPAVSQHLQRTETKLGMPLVSRAGRNVTLSEAGRAIKEIAPTVITAVDATRDRLGAFTQLRSGHVRLSGFPSASATFVPELFSKLRQSRPGLSLSYIESEPPESLRLIAEGKVDVGIVCSYPRLPLDNEWLEKNQITIFDLYTDPLYAVLSHDHPLANESVIELMDLEDDDWVAGCVKCREFVVDACKTVGYEPKISMETDNFIAVLGFVSMGLGVTLLPSLSIGTAALPNGAVTRSTNPQEHRIISLAVSQESLTTPAVKATISALLNQDGSKWNLLRYKKYYAPD